MFSRCENQSHEERIVALEKHRDECDQLHKSGNEHRKRQEDALNNHAQSNLLLAKSMTEMTITMSEIISRDKTQEPVIKFWSDLFVTGQTSYKMWKVLGVIASTILAIAGVITLMVKYL